MDNASSLYGIYNSESVDIVDYGYYMGTLAHSELYTMTSAGSLPNKRMYVTCFISYTVLLRDLALCVHLCVLHYGNMEICVCWSYANLHILCSSCFLYIADGNLEDKEGQFMGGALATNGDRFIVSAVCVYTTSSEAMCMCVCGG